LKDYGINGSSINHILMLTMSEREKVKAFKRTTFAPVASTFQTSH